ncbi:LysR family transcriptional regulator [Chromobacterium subtsugae]|uniref:LysR family transcriptional regulator n=1 Tax=Chromobacterium subtsugae TaxID=251747 RepID=A0ABS7F9V9_9NEIS|nr:MULTISPECIES: LysR family transcriptional regulator [Chromobacterium]KUM02491.1 transcriptional regulator [Chromobacterium subtsugae]KZE87876.1 transcriptional regulator [Chromobacterium sp. F49]MBW7565368.1 LysR family transcriptional regulator [Chromobacterium subtsugae]MBW8286781.1 LysR family transcriptional regulator [Chromobacterium subtsugae]WSE90742.1 LysR substrate-binding domain-containing protein [Chromobacterium subtsugae]
MIEELRALAVFAKTVETGSFRAAARALQLSPSVVSHHVSQLESRLGAALLYRSTRRLSLTADGETLFQHAQAMLRAAESGLDALAGRATEPTGRLSLTLPAFFARSPLTARLAGFARRHPKVELALDYSDEKRDLVRDGIDLAIRIGELPDSALKSRRLFDMPRLLVAAPALLSARPAPRHPQELADWPWLGIRMRPDHKTLLDAAGEAHSFSIQPAIRANSLDAVCQLAIAGCGLATPPAFLAADDIAAGRLSEVEPEWQVEALGVYAVWPANAARASLTLRLTQYLSEMQQ